MLLVVQGLGQNGRRVRLQHQRLRWLRGTRILHAAAATAVAPVAAANAAIATDPTVTASADSSTTSTTASTTTYRATTQ